jgi:UDP-glucose 4-epimerase
VEDVARANLAGLISDVTDEVFNVGTGVQTTLRELCEMLLKVSGSRLQPEYVAARKVNNVQARRASTEKAERMLGFTAKVDLESGLRSLLQWRDRARLESVALAGGVA